MSGNPFQSRFDDQVVIGIDSSSGQNQLMTPNRNRAEAEAQCLRAKARAIKKTQRRLLQQLDESIRRSELCLKQAKSNKN